MKKALLFIPILISIAVSAQNIHLATPSGNRVMTDPVTGAFTTQAEILHTPVLLATTAALPANTYNNGTSGIGATLTANANGALTIDGVSVSAGNRILVKNEATQSNNFIYTVTQPGSVSTPYILTRGNYSAIGGNLIAGTHVYVQSGTLNAGTVWYQTITGTITIGTTNLSYLNEGRHDSLWLKATYIPPQSGVTQVLAPGNSVAYGDDASPLDSGYVYRVGFFYSIPVIDLGVPSTQIPAITGTSLLNENLGNTNLNVAEGGLNDLRNNTATNANYSGIVNGFYSMIANHFLGGYTAASSTTLAPSAQWSKNWPANSYGGKTATGAYCSTQGDSCEYNTPVSTTGVIVGLMGLAAAGSSGVIYIDGTKVDSVNEGTQNAVATYAPMARIYTGLSNTTHHVSIVVSGGSGLFILDYLGYLTTSSLYPFVTVEIP